MNKCGVAATAWARLGKIGRIIFPPKTGLSKNTFESAKSFWSADKKKEKMILECADLDILYYFRRAVRWMNLCQTLDEVDTIYKHRGKVFMNLDIECCICQGAALSMHESCNHPNGTVHNITILNNDFVVKNGREYGLIPDDDLRKAVETGISQDVYNIPAHLRDLIRNNAFIPLSNRTLVVVDSPVSSNLVEEKIFRPIAQMQGFVDCFGSDYYPKVIL